jgi:hypothetical protein
MFSIEKRQFYNILFYCIIIFIIFMVYMYIDNNYNNYKIKNDSKIIDLGDGRRVMIQELENGRKEEEPRVIKTIGSKLVCDVVAELTQQNILVDHKLPNTKSPISGGQLSTDCYLDGLNLAFDYNPKELYEFNSSSFLTKDIYEFYYRLAIKESKKDQLSEKGISLINIPYFVDMCVENKNSYSCEERVNLATRKERIKNYIKNNINSLLEIR